MNEIFISYKSGWESWRLPAGRFQPRAEIALATISATVSPVLPVRGLRRRLHGGREARGNVHPTPRGRLARPRPRRHPRPAVLCPEAAN
jgi:hypothetical protein